MVDTRRRNRNPHNDDNGYGDVPEGAVGFRGEGREYPGGYGSDANEFSGGVVDDGRGGPVDDEGFDPGYSRHRSGFGAFGTRDPNDAEAYNVRGSAYGRAGLYKEAIADFNRAIEIDPRFSRAYANRALVQRRNGRTEEALADYNRAIQADPNYGPAYIGRANLLRAHSNYDQALSDLTQAIRLTPESAEALHARGLVYQKMERHREAIIDFLSRADRDHFIRINALHWVLAKDLFNFFNDSRHTCHTTDKHDVVDISFAEFRVF